MTTTDARPEIICPAWCAECSEPDPGIREHFTPVVSLPGDDPDLIPTMGEDFSRVWALARGDRSPAYSVHVSRIMSAAEVRETATQLLAFVDRIEAEAQGDTTKALILGALAPMLRELREVRDLPDDDPRRQAALKEKRRLLDIVEEYETAGAEAQS